MNQTTQTLSKTTSGVIPRISIIGAGISGLALACRLRSRNIPFSIYEARTQTSIGHGYAITLKRRAWKPLVKALRLTENHQIFCQETAVDRLVGGSGQIYRDQGSDFQAVDRDVRQWLIQKLTERGVSIQWGHKLVAVKEAQHGNCAELTFENKATAEADIVVDGAGLRSPAFDYNISSPSQPRLLPYATYYGTRRYQASSFIDRFGHWFGDGNTLEFSPANAGEPFIYLQKVHLPGKEASEHTIELRWLYSRPPLSSGDDPLYRPKRKPEEAKNIPSEFYSEILQSIKIYWSDRKRAILKQFFSLQELHEDRILNWHLRLRLPQPEYFISHSKEASYTVVALGDAAHGLPIVKSNGANIAMNDAKTFDRWLEQHLLGSRNPDANFYKDSDCYKTWYQEAREAIQRLRQMHAQELFGDTELDEVIGFSHDIASQNPSHSPSGSGSEADDETKGRL